MNALTKLFSFKPAKKSLKAPVTLCGLFVAAILFSPGCECLTGEDRANERPKRWFLTLNVADGIPSVETNVLIGTPPVKERLAGPALTGIPTSAIAVGPMSKGEEWIDATYTFSAAGTTAILDTYPARAYAWNLIVAMGTPAAPLIRNIGMAPVVTPNVIVMQADHTIGPIDIYVTAPGTNLATVGPDAADRAYANYTIMNAIHTGATFQVRATLAGTKTVVADFGTTTAAKERTSYVFVMAEVDGAKLLRNREFTQN